MKLILRIGLLPLIIHLLLVLPSHAKTPVRVGVYNNAPILFTDEDGRSKGLFIDIFEHIAASEDWKIEYVQGEFTELLKQLKAGNLDLLPGLAYSREREKYIDFTFETVMANWAQIYSPRGGAIHSILELQGKKVAVLQGDIYFHTLRRMLENFNIQCRFLEADEYKTVFEMLKANYVDLAVVNRLYGKKYKDSYNAIDTQVIFSPVELRYGLPKGRNIEILGAIDSHLIQLKADENSIYYKAISHWLLEKRNTFTPKWLLGSLYIAVGTALFLSATALLFQRQVRKRTRQLEAANSALESQIAEREKAEESLQKFERIVEASSDAMALVDNNNRHVLANLMYLQTLGQGDGDIRGVTVKTAFGSDFYDKELSEPVARCLQGNVVHVQTRPCEEHSNKRYWNITLNPYYTINDELEGYVVDLRDVTEQVELQNRLKNSQKMEAIGMLAGGVAHDLNNILSGLVSYPDILLVNRSVDDPMTKPLKTIKRSGERAATIVQDLLTLARRGVGSAVPINLNTIARDFLTSPEHHDITKDIHNIEYVIDLDHELKNIQGSTTHLSKMLMNLFTNGIEAMPKGGKLTIGTGNIILTKELIGYELIPSGEYVKLYVADTGTGMATSELNRVFEPFYTSKVMGRSGTGLGMAVVWGAMKDHDGYIDISSRPGRGTVFTAYFPITQEAVPKSETTILKDYAGNNESILIIDDLEEQQMLASTILKQLGYVADTASSGEEAVEMCSRQPYDLLILDMIMPGGMDGYTTYEKIVAKTPGQKAIIASGFSESSRVKKAQLLGAGQYIKKPYTVEILAKAVRQELIST